MNTLKAISDFYEQVVQYETLVKEWKNAPSKDNENEIQNSRTELQRCYPKLEKSIARYGEYSPVGKEIGMKLDVFEVAFDSIDKSNVSGKLNAINEIKNILNRAIGNLETEGDSWPDKKDRLRQPLKKATKKRSTYQKIWKWIDTHRILSILVALAALATILGVIYSIFFT